MKVNYFNKAAFPMNCELKVGAEEMINLSTSQDMWASGTRHIARSRLHHSPSHRPHSSPVRSELSCYGSPVRRGHSPFASRADVLSAPQHLLASMISTDFMKNVPKTPPAVAYYSDQPPSTPLYLLPISGSYTSHKSDKIQQLPNPQVKNSDGKKFAKKILHLILKNATKTVVQAKSNTSHHTQQVSGKVKNSDVAIQTTSSATDRHSPIEDEDVYSFSSESGEGREGWQWDVRALRNSHVRLVLRQLRQLRNIERLARALRHNPHSYPNPYRRATSQVAPQPTNI